MRKLVLELNKDGIKVRVEYVQQSQYYSVITSIGGVEQLDLWTTENERGTALQVAYNIFGDCCAEMGV
jgi:hypothetical protein